MTESVFSINETEIRTPWKDFLEIDKRLIRKWRKVVDEANLNLSLSRLKARIQGRKLTELLCDNDFVIETTREQCGSIMQGIFKSILFFVTSTDGVVLTVTGQDVLVQRMEVERNLGPGTVFSMSETGINAITVARALEQWVYLSGEKHDLELFSKWSCFCSPIRYNGEIVAYMDMSFSEDEDHLLMAAIFDLALRGTEEALSVACPDARKESILDGLRQYKLAPREQEIGYMWLMNYSALRIANELCLAEGTVRNVVKKVYRKTDVYDKGQFMRKFIG